MLDETCLETGTLNSAGVENARLLKALTELQKVMIIREVSSLVDS
jgi:hypothetical protein